MGLRLLIRRLRELPNAAGAEHPALLYMDSWLSTETEAAAKFAVGETVILMTPPVYPH